MRMETMLAENINIVGEKARYDAACKKLLANKVILAWIMKTCIEEYKEFSIKEIAERFIEGEPQISQVAVNPDEEMIRNTKQFERDEQIWEEEQITGTSTEDSTIKEGTITYDIRFHAVVPRTGSLIKLFINVEAQNNFYPGYPIVKRGIYYCSRMISSQYGTEFTNKHYEKIKKVYSVWICMNPPKHRENTISRYIVREESLIGNVSEKRENYDLMTVIMICLGKTEDDKYNGILKLLDVLLSSDKKAEEKKKILQEEFHIEMTKELESEVSQMCNLSDGVEQKGIEKGIQKGIEKGIQVLIADNLEFNVPIEKIKAKLQKNFELDEMQAQTYIENYFAANPKTI